MTSDSPVNLEEQVVFNTTVAFENVASVNVWCDKLETLAQVLEWAKQDASLKDRQAEIEGMQPISFVHEPNVLLLARETKATAQIPSPRAQLEALRAVAS